MTRSLVLAEVVDGVLAPVTAQAVTAAVSLGGEVVLALVAQDPQSLVPDASLIGVTEIVTVAVPGSDRDHEQSLAAAAALVADVQPDQVIAGFTIRSSAFAAALGHKLDLGVITDAIAVYRDDSQNLVATRSIYAGRVRAHVVIDGARPGIVLVRPSIWEPADPGGSPVVRVLTVEIPTSRVRTIELVRPSGGVDLSSADVIFSIGRGAGSQENVANFAAMAAKLGVALGASRPIIDAGWLPAAHQVGQTGSTVKPRLYVAFGISGALHHLAGMQNSRTIVVVNSDRNAPLFDNADIGAIEDIHDVIEQLTLLA
ncbi:MAG: electron transfer flavoprotein subunit alpha/FixB family protein [Actinobacteria bacterium]|nr:electron transfer flavoprotein subunit alpha/FixB family protein [Actinomycetota bacterium]